MQLLRCQCQRTNTIIHSHQEAQPKPARNTRDLGATHTYTLPRSLGVCQTWKHCSASPTTITFTATAKALLMPRQRHSYPSKLQKKDNSYMFCSVDNPPTPCCISHRSNTGCVRADCASTTIKQQQHKHTQQAQHGETAKLSVVHQQNRQLAIRLMHTTITQAP
jgi:hypothetical protein